MRLFKKLIGTTLVLVGLAAPFIVWWQYNNLYDWWRLRDYTPPAAIVNIADEDTFNAYTKRLFYVNHPQLLSSVASFRADCPENLSTIVLGCYHSGQQGIYIYNVQDPTLAGVQQVTAAHEVLHSIYARLSDKERNYVDGLLESYYTNGLSDSVVSAEIKLYQQTEPGSVMDEMNSTFGTEIANLPPALNAYYAQFFTNRQAIVAYETNYQAAFTSRTNQINADDAELATQKQTITSEEATLNSELSEIQTDRTSLNALDTPSEYQAYDAAVGPFNAEVNAYNQGIAKLQSDITAYNNLVNSRNAMASDLEGLDSAIDTRLTTQSAQ